MFCLKIYHVGLDLHTCRRLSPPVAALNGEPKEAKALREGPKKTRREQDFKCLLRVNSLHSGLGRFTSVAGESGSSSREGPELGVHRTFLAVTPEAHL